MANVLNVVYCGLPDESMGPAYWERGMPNFRVAVPPIYKVTAGQAPHSRFPVISLSAHLSLPNQSTNPSTPTHFGRGMVTWASPRNLANGYTPTARCVDSICLAIAGSASANGRPFTYPPVAPVLGHRAEIGEGLPILLSGNPLTPLTSPSGPGWACSFGYLKCRGNATSTTYSSRALFSSQSQGPNPTHSSSYVVYSLSLLHSTCCCGRVRSPSFSSLAR